MTTSELLEDDRLALKDALEAALPDEQLEPLKKKARALADEIADSIEWSMKDNLAANLSYHVREMAGRAVGALLEGNESEMIRWLSCDKRGARQDHWSNLGGCCCYVLNRCRYLHLWQCFMHLNIAPQWRHEPPRNSQRDNCASNNERLLHGIHITFCLVVARDPRVA